MHSCLAPHPHLGLQWDGFSEDGLARVVEQSPLCPLRGQPFLSFFHRNTDRTTSRSMSKSRNQRQSHNHWWQRNKLCLLGGTQDRRKREHEETRRRMYSYTEVRVGERGEHTDNRCTIIGRDEFIVPNYGERNRSESWRKEWKKREATGSAAYDVPRQGQELKTSAHRRFL